MNDVEKIEGEFCATDFLYGNKSFYFIDRRTPTPDVVEMKASTSGTSATTTTTKSNDSKRGFVNDALPNPENEPAVTDSRFLDASIHASKRQTENAERDYRERGPSVVAEGRNSTAQLYNKYCEDEERKRQETHKAKEAYHQPVTVTPVARAIQDRKRRQTDMDDEWVKRQQGQHQQLNHWMGPPPPQAYHQYHPHQQYMMMQQQQQQQQQQMPRTFPSTSSAAPSTPQDSNSSVNTPQQLNQSSPPSIASAPVQPSTSADLNFCTGSSPPKAIDDLSDLPTPRENVDFLAAESEFRCDKDEIKDLGPDIFDEFFSDMTPSSSSPMGAPMFSSTPVPTPTAQQAQSSRSYPVGYSEMDQHQLQLQQQQQQMMIQQQQREMYMKQQAMYANGYGQAPTTAQQQQHAQYIHHMRMQQMRYQQQNGTMMDPRMMSYYQQQQHQMAANGVALQQHPMYHQQLHHQHQQFAPHPMN